MCRKVRPGVIQPRVDVDPPVASQTSLSPDLIRQSPRIPVIAGMPGSGPGMTWRVSAEGRCRCALALGHKFLRTGVLTYSCRQRRHQRPGGYLECSPMPLLCSGPSAAGDRGKMKSARSVCAADAVPHGRMPKADGPGARSGAAMLAKSHSNFRVTRGSITSSTQNASAVR
jgi:hypothetical protein